LSLENHYYPVRECGFSNEALKARQIAERLSLGKLVREGLGIVAAFDNFSASRSVALSSLWMESFHAEWK